jgi:hypothetical protein
MIVVYGMVVGLWIFHNIRIWRKKGRNINVAVVGDRKIFSDASGPPDSPDLKAS